MAEYCVEAKSRKKLRSLAYSLRRYLGLRDRIWIPIVELLDVLAEIFDNFSYEIVPDNSLPPDIHAKTDVISGHIRIKESVYERACKGEGRDRMTIAHEIAHFFTVCHCGFELARNYNQKKIPAFRDPEWQAKCFAGEFMVAYHLTGQMTPAEIVDACGVSLDAAEYQHSHRN